MTISLSREDPDGHHVERQSVSSGNGAWRTALVRGSAYASNPIGRFFDPDEIAAAHRADAARATLQRPMRYDEHWPAVAPTAIGLAVREERAP